MPDRRADPFAFGQMLDWMKPMDWMKPNAQLGGAAERAMQSFGQASQLLSQTTEAMMRKQSEMLSESMSALAAGMQQLPRLRTPQDVFAAQATALQAGMEAAVSNMRDMTEIWQRCSTGMADLWLQSLANNGQAAAPENPPRPLRKAAE